MIYPKKNSTRFIKNMKLSASHGSMGGQSIGAMKQAGVTQKKMNEILKKHSRIMDGKKMTPEFMRDYFYEIQQELDYWTGDKIDPQSIFSAPNNFFDNPNRKTKPKWKKYPEKFNKFECASMITQAYIFRKTKKFIWTFSSYDTKDEVFSD